MRHQRRASLKIIAHRGLRYWQKTLEIPKQPSFRKSCSQLSSKTIKMISFSCHSQSTRGICHSHRPLCTIRRCDKITIKITTICSSKIEIIMQSMRFNRSIGEVYNRREAKNSRLRVTLVKWWRISPTKISSLIQHLSSLITLMVKRIVTVLAQQIWQQLMAARRSISAPFSKCSNNRIIVNSSKTKSQSNPICRKKRRMRTRTISRSERIKSARCQPHFNRLKGKLIMWQQMLISCLEQLKCVSKRRLRLKIFIHWNR